MKNILLLFALVFALNSSHATVWRVNNQDNTADFTDLDVAHNSSNVQANDTLYVEGSSQAYKSITCTKPLTFIGPGYLLNINQKSANMVPAIVYALTFNAGSEGSRVIGLTFNWNSSSAPQINTNSISIERCYIRGYITINDNVEGVIITGNYCAGINDWNTGTEFFDVYFNNNIVTGDMTINNTCNIVACNNNIFLGDSYTFVAYHFRNNIVVDGTAALNIQSSYIQNNIASNNIFTGDNLNVSDINALFVGGESPDAKYVLSETSQAKGAGYEGTDCGIFGGDYPYIISGLPPLPIITELDVDDAASVETGLKVKMKVIAY
jgi:hypothetical protein